MRYFLFCLFFIGLIGTYPLRAEYMRSEPSDTPRVRSGTIISFILLTTDKTNKQYEESRSQINFVRSMHTQYNCKGIDVVFVLVDGSYLDLAPADAYAFTNFRYDWNLPSDIELRRYEGGLQSEYPFKNFPSTIFLDRNNVISTQWSGKVLPAQLALSIQKALSLPAQRNEQVEIFSELRFPGLPAAQKLNEYLWLIDGNMPWIAGRSISLQCLYVTEEDKAEIEVRIFPVDDPQGKSYFLKGCMNRTSSDASAVIQSNLPRVKSNTFLWDETLIIKRAGSYSVKVIVRGSTAGTKLYSGETVMIVKN